MPSPDPDTIPTRAYNPCDEKSTQQQHIVETHVEGVAQILIGGRIRFRVSHATLEVIGS